MLLPWRRDFIRRGRSLIIEGMGPHLVFPGRIRRVQDVGFGVLGLSNRALGFPRP